MPKEKKKMLILAILGILRDGTDAEHRIRQAEIISRLQQDYALSATRKSVRKNLGDLQEAGYPVVFRKGWYYDHGFSPAELNYMLNCVAVSNLPALQRKAMIGRLYDLGGPFFEPDAVTGVIKPLNNQFIHTNEVIHQAIETQKQISFRYGDFDVDKELHVRLDDTGKPLLWHVNPFRIVMTNGRNELVCNVDGEGGLSRFRVDRILEARLLKSAAKPIDKMVDVQEDAFNEPPKAENPFTPSSPARKYRIQLRRDHINELLDWFGMNVIFEHVTDDTAEAIVVSDAASLEVFLRQSVDFASLVQ